MSKVFLNIGVHTLDTSYENIFFKKLNRMDSNYFIINRKNKFAIGFKKHYCGVNTFVPVELKNYWVSDHHLLSMLYSFGSRHFTIIPYDGQLYIIQFHRIAVPNLVLFNQPIDDLPFFQDLTTKHPLLNNLIPWIKLFTFNHDLGIFNRCGLVYPELIKFDKNDFQDQIKKYQYENDIHHISDARKKIKNTFEGILASITMG